MNAPWDDILSSESQPVELLAPYISNGCTVTEVVAPGKNPLGNSSLHARPWGWADLKIAWAKNVFDTLASRWAIKKTRSFRVTGADWMWRGVEILGHKIWYCRDGVLMSEAGKLIGSYENIEEGGQANRKNYAY